MSLEERDAEFLEKASKKSPTAEDSLLRRGGVWKRIQAASLSLSSLWVVAFGGKDSREVLDLWLCEDGDLRSQEYGLRIRICPKDPDQIAAEGQSVFTPQRPLFRIQFNVATKRLRLWSGGKDQEIQ